MPALTEGKHRIMLKPNMVTEAPSDATNPEVVRTLADLMLEAGKEVGIGEGSAGATGHNMLPEGIFHTKDPGRLNDLQEFVFDSLGYTQMAREMGIPLINLHTGEMREVEVPGGLAFDRLTLHRSLVDADLLCSVAMMKTHTLATVTLGMKNLIGLYPGVQYGTVRNPMHTDAMEAGSPGIAYEIVDMVRANKLGLVVIDGSVAMEGDGPSISWGGRLVDMNVIIASKNALAADMVAASAMGFDRAAIPTYAVAHQVGMTPSLLTEIEVRGEPLGSVRKEFRRPNVMSWSSVKGFFGAEELLGVSTGARDESWGRIKAGLPH